MADKLTTHEYTLRFAALIGIATIIVLLIALLNQDVKNAASPNAGMRQEQDAEDPPRPVSPLNQHLQGTANADRWDSNDPAGTGRTDSSDQTDTDFTIGNLRTSGDSAAPSEALRVDGNHEGRVAVLKTAGGYQFRFREQDKADHMSLVGNFNSWDSTRNRMRREGELWVCEISLAPIRHEFKFLGPNDGWFPPGNNLGLALERTVQAAPPQETNVHNPQRPAKRNRTARDAVAPQNKGDNEQPTALSDRGAREILDNAGLYEGRSGVWYFPQSSRLVIRQYGKLAKRPAIQRALSRLGARLPNTTEMENPPPQR